MSSRIFFMPFGFGILELILIAVVIVLILKAITGDKRGGRVIAGILVAIGTILIVPVLILSLMFVARSNTQHVVYHEQQATSVEALEQVNLEAERVRLETQQMAEDIQAKAEEIRQRTSVIVDEAITASTHDTPHVVAVDAVDQSYIQPVPPVEPVVVAPEYDRPVEVNDQAVLRSYEDPSISRVDKTEVSVTRTSSAGADVSVENVGTSEVEPTQVVVQSGMTVAGAPWTDAIEAYQDFEADVYPSMEDAAEALGRRVGQRLMQDLGNSEAEVSEASYVYVWRDEASGGDAAFISRDVLDAVARGLKQKMFDPAYVSVERPINGTSVLVAIQEMRFEVHNRWRKQAETKSGGLALRVKTPDDAFSVSTRFSEKPWLVDRSGFTHDFDNNPWLVAYSDSTHAQQSEAYWDAVHKAADAVLPMAEARISRLSGADQQRFHAYLAKDSNWLRDRVADELVSRNLLTDQFTQQFDKPAYTVWREAVLVNATPQQIEEIGRSLVQGVNVQVQNKRNAVLSAVALGVLILGTYLFLSVATKGYYAWSLRLALMIGLGVVVFLFMSLA